MVGTRSAEDEPDLPTVATTDLKPYVPFGDCLVALAPDWSGTIWWASRKGLVGTIAADTGQVRVTDLGEDVDRQLATDESGVYVVTDAALHRLVAGADGTPRAVWRSEYDGSSGSAPVLLDGGVVAITDRADSRLGVLFVARDDGRHLCRQSVFDEGDGATSAPWPRSVAGSWSPTTTATPPRAARCSASPRAPASPASTSSTARASSAGAPTGSHRPREPS